MDSLILPPICSFCFVKFLNPPPAAAAADCCPNCDTFDVAFDAADADAFDNACCPVADPNSACCPIEAPNTEPTAPFFAASARSNYFNLCNVSFTLCCVASTILPAIFANCVTAATPFAAP